jgi:hypothetical protein
MTRAAPGNAAAWVALGVARSMVGDHAQGRSRPPRTPSSSRRVSRWCTSRTGDVLRLAGQFADSRMPYAAAVALAPDNADALNKLAGSERHRPRLRCRAVAPAPRPRRRPAHPYAQVNLATLAVEEGALDEARRALGSRCFGRPACRATAADAGVGDARDARRAC